MTRNRLLLLIVVALSVGLLTASSHTCPGWMVVVNGDSPSDQTVAGVITAKNPAAEIIYVQRDHLPDSSRAYVTRQAENQPYDVITVGGTAVVSEEVVRDVEARLGDVDNSNRISGSDRYHTAALSNFVSQPRCP